MDPRLQGIRDQKALENQIAALENSSASKADMDELKSIPNNGLYRGAYGTHQHEKIAEILGKLFPGPTQASADSLEDKNVAELKEMAKAQDVPEYYKLNRQELVEALS